MAYQQLHAGKVKLNGLAGIQHHLIDRNRVKTNPDIDLTRSHFNHSIEDLSPEHLARRVHLRIKQLNLKRKLRDDAVGLEDIIIGASVDFMLKLGSEQREKYFADALHFFQNRYGKENVMYCQCHLDESNPHIHIGIVPVTPDGRLSARDVFTPKTLEQLQTDFHRDVAQKYGLERGDSHKRNYLELNKFKAHQAKIQLQNYINEIDTTQLEQANIEEIQHSAHFPSTGVLFKSEDKHNIQLPTENFLTLQAMAQNGIKSKSAILLLAEQNKALSHENSILKSDCDEISHRFSDLDNETTPYTDIPKLWRKHIDDSIDFWKKTFTHYCHDVNRATVKVFIATHFNLDKTEKIMRNHIKKTGAKNIQKHIKNVVLAAHFQLKKNSPPTTGCPPSWKPPKPTDTDYKKSDETNLAPPPSFAQLGGDGINWDMVNWDLLTELDKEEILRKLELARWL